MSRQPGVRVPSAAGTAEGRSVPRRTGRYRPHRAASPGAGKRVWRGHPRRAPHCLTRSGTRHSQRTPRYLTGRIDAVPDMHRATTWAGRGSDVASCSSRRGLSSGRFPPPPLILPGTIVLYPGSRRCTQAAVAAAVG